VELDRSAAYELSAINPAKSTNLRANSPYTLVPVALILGVLGSIIASCVSETTKLIGQSLPDTPTRARKTQWFFVVLEMALG